jgi:hypothetical protein
MDWHVVALLVADRCHQRYRRYPSSSHHSRRPQMLTKKLDQGDKLILDDDLDAFLGGPSLPPALSFFTLFAPRTDQVRMTR